MTTVYERALAQLNRTMYKKGAHAGDAPLAQRGLTQLRLVKGSDCVFVRAYKTDIVTFHKDGRMVIDCDNHIDRPVTQKYLGKALTQFVPRVAVHFRSVFSHRQPVVTMYVPNVGYKRFRYYDGITFEVDSDVKITSELETFWRYRLDETQVASFATAIEDSGFKSMFKLLHHVSEPPTGAAVQLSPRSRQVVLDRHLRHGGVLTDSDQAEQWANIVQLTAWDRKWHILTTYPQPYSGEYRFTKRSASATWALIMSNAKRAMHVVSETDITCVDA